MNFKYKNNPFISILCITYNHEEYIEEALNGFLSQQTEYSYEILIHDDASTDKTPEIIKKYEALYPTIIKPIYQIENQYSKGILVNWKYNFSRAKGKYIAFCEGDDVWIDNLKLQKQIGVLEKNPEINFTFHSAIQIDYLTPDKKRSRVGVYGNANTCVSHFDVMHRTHGMIPTASCVLRKKALKSFNIFRKFYPSLPVGDLFFQFFAAEQGSAFYMHESMSIYRLNTISSWSKKIKTNTDAWKEHQVSMIKAYKKLNYFTQSNYRTDIKLLLMQRIFMLGFIEKSNNQIQYNINLYKKLFEVLDETISNLFNAEETYILYAGGTGADYIVRYHQKDKILCILDKYLKNDITHINDLPIYHLDALNHLKGYKIIITLFGRSKAVVNELIINYGIAQHDIINLDDYLIDTYDL